MMYKTGDYARLLDDGCVDCFGRKDGQIKINGQRIETGEIEQRLLECSGIIEAVVVPYRVRETLHIAAVVCVNDSYDEVEVRGQLADRLPPFAIPESLVVVTEIAKAIVARPTWRSCGISCPQLSATPCPPRYQRCIVTWNMRCMLSGNAYLIDKTLIAMPPFRPRWHLIGYHQG